MITKYVKSVRKEKGSENVQILWATCICVCRCEIWGRSPVVSYFAPMVVDVCLMHITCKAVLSAASMSGSRCPGCNIPTSRDGQFPNRFLPVSIPHTHMLRYPAAGVRACRDS